MVSPELIIAIVSATVAVVSAVFAWQAATATHKTYSVELLSQLYGAYHSEEMLRDLQIIWGLYHKTWENDSATKAEAEEKTNRGIPIQEDSAQRLVGSTFDDPPQHQAIHNVVNFWTYLTLLVDRKTLTPEEITAFTSPRILGFLYPIEKAWEIKWDLHYKDSSNLWHMYKILNRANQY